MRRDRFEEYENSIPGEGDDLEYEKDKRFMRERAKAYSSALSRDQNEWYASLVRELVKERGPMTVRQIASHTLRSWGWEHSIDLSRRDSRGTLLYLIRDEGEAAVHHPEAGEVGEGDLEEIDIPDLVVSPESTEAE